MKKVYPNMSWGQEILKHKELPIFYLKEFDFYRIIEFKESLYRKTFSELHKNNLREPKIENRYSNLFNLGKVSYWSSDGKIAKKEILFHNPNLKNFIVFHSYDDFSSTISIMKMNKNLIIVDGTKLLDFSTILEKYENYIEFTVVEKELLIKLENLILIVLHMNQNEILVELIICFLKKFSKNLH